MLSVAISHAIRRLVKLSSLFKNEIFSLSNRGLGKNNKETEITIIKIKMPKKYFLLPGRSNKNSVTAQIPPIAEREALITRGIAHKIAIKIQKAEKYLLEKYFELMQNSIATPNV